MATGDLYCHICHAFGHSAELHKIPYRKPDLNLRTNNGVLEDIQQRLARIESLLHMDPITENPATQLAAILDQARKHPLDLPDPDSPLDNHEAFTSLREPRESEEGDAD